MQKQNKHSLLSLAVVAALASSDYASSQALEEVVVTARKRAESLQDVPMAVSAFNSAQLQDNMVEIAAGHFDMGSNEASDEKPSHRVDLKEFAHTFADIDAILTPTTLTPAIPVAEVDEYGTPARFTRTASAPTP